MTRRAKNEYEFWVSNVCDKNVTVADLGLSIASRRHVNLLDSRHYNLTKEQLELSAKSGSLYEKRDKLKVRQVAPEIVIKPGFYVSKLPLHMAQAGLRSNVVIEDKRYEELDFSSESEEKFASDMANDEDDSK